MTRKHIFFWLFAGGFIALALLWISLLRDERREVAEELVGREQHLHVRNLSSAFAENLLISGREVLTLAASPLVMDALTHDRADADAEKRSNEALARLSENLLSSPRPHNVMLLDTKGKTRLFSKGISLLTENDMNHWLKDIGLHDAGRYSVLGPYASESGNRFMVFSAPVYVRDGIAGRLLVARNVAAWEDLLRGRSLPDSEDACFILNESGGVIMAFGSPRVDEAAFTPPLADMARSGEGAFSFEWNGETWRGRYVTLPDNNWLTLTARPESAIQIPFIKSAMAGVATLAVLLLAALLAWAHALGRARPGGSPAGQEENPGLSQLVRTGLREGVLELDAAGRVLRANDAALRILGCRNEYELLGQIMYAAPCHEEEQEKDGPGFIRPETCPLLRGLSSTGEPCGMLLTIWRKDGVPLLATHVFLPRIRDGKADGGHFIFQELFSPPANRRSALLRTFASVLDSWAIFDGNFRLAEASPALCRLFEAKNQNELRDILTPDAARDARQSEERREHSAQILGALEEARKKGRAACELVLGGIPASVLPSAPPYGTANNRGRMLCLAEVEKKLQNGTESYRLILHSPGLQHELDIQRGFEEKLLQNMLSVNPLGVVIIRDSKVIWLNRKARELVSLRVGDNPEQAYADAGMREVILDCLRKTGRMDGCTLELRSPSGEAREAHFAAQMLHFAGGEYCVVWIMDLSENKELLTALEKARGAARAADSFQNEFLARLNHEMRTPLNAIMGMGYLFSLTDMTEQQRDYIDKLQHGAQTLLGMVNQLLDFSSVTRDTLELEESTFLLSSLVEGLCSANAANAGKKDLEFVIRVDPRIPGVLTGDPVRLAQALHSLVDNAIRFTDSGEVRFEARLENAPDALAERPDEVTIRFEISDTGAGMDQETLARVLQPFGQGDGSNTREHEGLGLGLPLAQRVCSLMGGEMIVDSTPGKGTTIACILRMKGADSSAPAPSLCEPGALKALLVDDNASSLAALREMLEILGFNVTTATSGNEALDMLRRSAGSGTMPDVVLIDWRMPGMDGLECAYRAKDMLSELGVPPLVLLTGHAHGPDAEEFTRAGIAARLAKPFPLSVLRETLAPLLRREAQKSSPVALRVLLVEDNEINQEIALSLLEEHDLSISVAHNGLEAVDMIREAGEEAYALVLMDVQMPIMDGLEATSRIRGMGYSSSDLPIVAMTAQGQEEDKRQCFAAGMNDHMTKPLDPERLNAVLHRWLGVGGSVPVPARRNGVVFEKRASDLVSAAMQAIASEHKTSGVLIPATGLENVGGNESLYLKLLRKFFESYTRLDTDIEDAMRHGDAELAIRLAHTVKSVSASLGLVDFSSIAAEVEKELKAGEVDKTMRAAFAAGLHESLRAVDEYLAAHDSKPAGARGLDTGDTEGANTCGPESSAHELLPEHIRHAHVLVQEIIDNLELDWGVVINNKEELERMADGTCCGSRQEALNDAVENFDVPQTRTAAQNLLACLELLLEQNEQASLEPEEQNGQG